VANPKWKLSRMRTRRRRSHDALTAPNVVNCSSCKAPTLPHRLCLSCGTYDGRQVIQLKQDEAGDSSN
jgi:large subunit ribosomal protein L32